MFNIILMNQVRIPTGKNIAVAVSLRRIVARIDV